MRRGRLTLAAAVAAAGLLAAGCATVDTAPNQGALEYSNGFVSAQSFGECVGKSEFHAYYPLDDIFYYPAGVRTIDFSHDSAAMFPPFTVTTHDGQVMEISGSISLELNRDCTPRDIKDPGTGQVVHWDGGYFQAFHEQIGAQDTAYSTSSGAEPGDGWRVILNKYVREPTEQSLGITSLNYNWQDLNSNPAVRAQWEKDALGAIEPAITRKAGAPYFLIRNVLLLKPVPPANLQAGLEAVQGAQLRSSAADIDKSAALNFPGGMPAYIAYQSNLANLDLIHQTAQAIHDGKVQAVPVTPNGNVILPAPGK